MTAGKKKDAALESVAESKYRPLKKTMKKTFAALKESSANNLLPPASLVEQFMAEAKAMVSYPGFGDDYYQEFWQTCQNLHAAYNAQDGARFRELLAQVRSLKKECHARFKG